MLILKLDAGSGQRPRIRGLQIEPKDQRLIPLVAESL